MSPNEKSIPLGPIIIESVCNADMGRTMKESEACCTSLHFIRINCHFQTLKEHQRWEEMEKISSTDELTNHKGKRTNKRFSIFLHHTHFQIVTLPSFCLTLHLYTALIHMHSKAVTLCLFPSKPAPFSFYTSDVPILSPGKPSYIIHVLQPIDWAQS